jgi:hypothetical protein
MALGVAASKRPGRTNPKQAVITQSPSKTKPYPLEFRVAVKPVVLSQRKIGI